MSQSWTPRDILQEEFDKFFSGNYDDRDRDIAFHWFKKGDRIGVQTGKKLERESIIETLNRIRELTDYQHGAWKRFDSTFNQSVAEDILELIDHLLKDLDK